MNFQPLHQPLHPLTAFAKRQLSAQLIAPVRELRSADLAPRQMAAAFALGTAVSFSPLPMSDLLLATLFVTRFKMNKAMVMIALAIWNDLLILPLYAPGLKLGRLLVSALVQLPAQPTAAQQAGISVGTFVVGNGVLALLVSVVAFLTIWLGMSGWGSRPRFTPIPAIVPSMTQPIENNIVRPLKITARTLVRCPTLPSLTKNNSMPL